MAPLFYTCNLSFYGPNVHIRGLFGMYNHETITN